MQNSTPSLPVPKSTPSLLCRTAHLLSCENSIPSLPVQNSTPSLPVQNSTPSLYVQNSTPSLPVQSSTPSLPVQNSIPSLPIQNSTLSLPLQNSTPSLPVQNSSPSLAEDSRLLLHFPCCSFVRYSCKMSSNISYPIYLQLTLFKQTVHTKE